MKLFINYFILAFLGCFLTILITLMGYNEVIASSIISIIISIYTITIKDENKISWAGFTGSFAGMTMYKILFLDVSEYNFVNYLLGFIILSILVSASYSISEYISQKTGKNFFDGYGGRLGTIAFFSVLVFLLIKYYLFYQPTLIFQFDIYRNLLDIKFYLIIFSSIAASMISMEVKNAVSSLNENYKVLIVAITGIIGGILLYKFPFYGKDLAYSWYTGAFVGMSSYYILMLKRHYFFSGLISGVLYIITCGLLVGIGGKLGFISFISVLIMRGISKMYAYILSTNKVIEKIKEGKDVANINVNDYYAQKLVEKLLTEKNNGELDYYEIDEIKSEDFVIGEKIDYVNYLESLTSSIPNYFRLDDDIKNIISFFIDVGFEKFIYFNKVDNKFIGISYLNIDKDSARKMSFDIDSNFVKVISREKRLITFSKNGIKQSVFINRFTKEEFDKIEILTLMPIIKENSLSGFFMIIDVNKDVRIIEDNISLLKQFYKNGL